MSPALILISVGALAVAAVALDVETFVLFLFLFAAACALNVADVGGSERRAHRQRHRDCSHRL